MKKLNFLTFQIFIIFFLMFCSQELTAQDSDNDSYPDVTDIDDDNDGIIDTNETLGCTGALSYEFYDLSPPGNTVDNIPTTGALATGFVTEFNVNALQGLVDPGDTDDFSIRYSGSVFISADNTYTFYTTSDDGSKLYIDGIEIVDNDGLHGNRERNGNIFLNAGIHTITIEFFERGGGANLSVSYESVSIPKTVLPFEILLSGETCDFDGDGLTNNLDLDSDNDGIPDNVEAQSTFGYVTPSLVDSDGNGLDDAYESTPGAGEGLFPINTVATTNFDFINLDTDSDGLLDQDEAATGLTGTDTDGDGLDNATDTTDSTLPGGLPNYSDPNGTINTPSALPNTQNAGVAEVDYRDASLDTDVDGVIDAVDVDDDNDGILDIDENRCAGEIYYEFYDSTPAGNTVDNIPTTGALATGNSSSFDVDALQNLVDPGDTETFSIRYSGSILIETADTYTFFTSSDDGSKLIIDGIEVVDNDGLHGVRERSGSVTLGAGFHTITVLFFERTGGEFLSVSYQSTAISKTALPFSILFSEGDGCDTDGDGILNSLDLDSDNDGCNDVLEAYNTNTADADGDGIYGSSTPMVNPDGSVVGASYTTPADNDTNGTEDFLEPNLAPVIDSEPANVVIFDRLSTSFSAAIQNVNSYQWQLSTDGGTSYANISESSIYSGTTTNNLYISETTVAMNAYQYRLVASNSNFVCAVPVITNSAELMINVRSVITNRRITTRVNKDN